MPYPSPFVFRFRWFFCRVVIRLREVFAVDSIERGPYLAYETSLDGVSIVVIAGFDEVFAWDGVSD